MNKDYNNIYPDERNTHVEGELNSGQNSEQNGEHDSLFGMLLTESFLGGALGEVFAETIDAPEWTSELDVGKALDAYDEFRRDRTNGGFKLGVSGDLYGAFNRFGLHDIEDIIENNEICGDMPVVPPIIAMAHGQGSMVTAPSLSHG